MLILFEEFFFFKSGPTLFVYKHHLIKLYEAIVNRINGVVERVITSPGSLSMAIVHTHVQAAGGKVTTDQRLHVVRAR